MEEVQDPAIRALAQAMTQMAESQKTFREELKAEVFAMVTEKDETAKKEKAYSRRSWRGRRRLI